MFQLQSTKKTDTPATEQKTESSSDEKKDESLKKRK